MPPLRLKDGLWRSAESVQVLGLIATPVAHLKLHDVETLQVFLKRLTNERGAPAWRPTPNPNPTSVTDPLR